jgi:kynurenine--oxoglutarate transaminase/cysteine-S-conjugate beta-lyase/glutamine--phenylpyruvate transaminase
VLDKEELESVFNSKTKIIILNTPHNPLGKVFKREELESIADLCKKWNVLCISDEVYEWIVYKPKIHFRIGKLV